MPEPSRRDRQPVLDEQIRKSAKPLSEIVVEARNRIDAKVVKAAADGKLQRSAYLRDTLSKELREEYVRLQGNTDEWTAKTAKNVAREWRKLAINDLPSGDYDQSWAKFSRKYLDNIIAKVSPETVANLAARRVTGFSPAIGGMLQQDIVSLRRSLIEVQRLQALTGMTQDEMRRELMDRVTKDRPAWTFIDRAGKRWNASSYFSMLSRTTASVTSREAYVDTLSEAGHDLATIEGGIPPNCCEDCVRWAGKIVSVTGATKGYPTYQNAQDDGVFHPRCRHYLAVVLPGEVKEAEENNKKMREDAAKKGFPKTKSKIAPNDTRLMNDRTPPSVDEAEEPKGAKKKKPKREANRSALESIVEKPVKEVAPDYEDVEKQKEANREEARKLLDEKAENDARLQAIQKRIDELNADTAKIEQRLAREDRARDRT
jgi:hypothetical protein